VQQPKPYPANPVWSLVRLLARVVSAAIFAVDDIDLFRITTALDDPPRRRQRQAIALC
jgi:hypothetical protein